MAKKTKKKEKFDFDKYFENKKDKLIEYVKTRKLKDWIIFGFLALFLIFGFKLRAYHIDYPVIGYHSMKEDQSLSYADNMLKDKDFIRTKWYRCYYTSEQCYFSESELPTLSYFIIISWMLFGYGLFGPRLMIIIFSLLTIIYSYKLIKKISKNEYFALLVAFFVSVLPLGVFFGRNIQPEAPALFFSVAFMYYFYKWIESKYKDNKSFYISLAMFTGIILTKVTFLTMPLVFLFLIDYKYLLKNKDIIIKKFSLFILPLVLFAAWFFLIQKIMPGIERGSASNLFGAFVTFKFPLLTKSYWSSNFPILKSYVNDNWSIKLFMMSLLSIPFFVMKRKTQISRFFFGYLVSAFFYLNLLAYKINGHNYYQYPFIPLIALMMGGLIFFLGEIIKGVAKNSYTRYLALLIIIPLIAPMSQSIDAQFNTQFPGPDYAFEYLNKLTNENDRIFYLSQSQSNPGWHLKRFYHWIPKNSSVFKKYEEKYGIIYFVVHGYGFQDLNNYPDSKEYLESNYGVRQIGLFKKGDQFSIVYAIYEKGLNNTINDMNKYPAIIGRTYEYSFGSQELYVVTKND